MTDVCWEVDQEVEFRFADDDAGGTLCRDVKKVFDCPR